MKKPVKAMKMKGTLKTDKPLERTKPLKKTGTKK